MVMTEMPEALRHYWTMWNEPSLELVRGHLNQAVSEDFIFADPLHYHVGRDALEANVRTLRTDKPEYRFEIGSQFDSHNRRYRYEWHMKRKHRVLLVGLDIATLNEAGQVERVDGFFGPLKPLG